MELTAEQVDALREMFAYGFGTVLFFHVLGICIAEILKLIKR